MGAGRGVYTVTPTVGTSGAYSSGQCVGGLMQLGAGTPQRDGVLTSLTVLDHANQKAAFTVLFFDSDPTNATLQATPATVADGSAFAWGTSLPNCLGRVNVAAADYESDGSTAEAVASKLALGLRLAQAQASAGSGIYAVAMTTGTPTYAHANDLTFRFGLG